MAGPALTTRKLYKTKTLPDYSLTDTTIPTRSNGYGHEKLTWQRYQVNAKNIGKKT